MDGLILALIVLAGTVAYVAQLGFYSDDWRILSFAHFAPSQSLGDVFRAMYEPDVRMRPGQIGFYAVLYQWFGLHPAGYHIVILVLAAAVPVVLYLVLRELGVRRDAAFAAAALYGLLPNYSTDRVWLSASQASLSLLCALGCALAAFAAVRHAPSRAWPALLGVALILEACSIAAYEVAMPLLAAVAALVWLRGREGPPRIVATAALAGVLALGFAFKAATTTRMGSSPGIVRHAYHVVRGMFEGLVVNAGYDGIALPLTALRLVMRTHAWAALFLGIVAGAAVYLVLVRIAPRGAANGERDGDDVPHRAWVLALAAYVVGYAVFLTNENVAFTPTGMANRTADVAAAGIAIAIVGAAFWLGARAGTRRSLDVAYAIIAVFCASAATASGAIAWYWAAAADRQAAVLHELHTGLPRPAHDSTVLLAGVCPYIGPGVVLEAQWDTKGALRILYDDGSLLGDVLSWTTTVGGSVVQKRMYGATYRYPWSPSLIVYDVMQHKRVTTAGGLAPQLREDLRRCPFGEEGYGNFVL